MPKYNAMKTNGGVLEKLRYISQSWYWAEVSGQLHVDPGGERERDPSDTSHSEAGKVSELLQTWWT
jgi:hypothetical protein